MHALKRPARPSTTPPSPIGLPLPAERRRRPPSGSARRAQAAPARDVNLAPARDVNLAPARDVNLLVDGRRGALLRVLGLVERRGYTAVRLGVDAAADGTLRVALSVRGTRPTDLLARQLMRLVEVRSVELGP